MKFEDAYREYLKFVSVKQKITSRGTLEQRFESKILPFFSNYDIYNLKETDYLNWQNYILSFNLSNGYIKGLHYLMCGFYDWAIDFINLDCNIPRKVGQFRLKNVIVKHDFYTLKEFKKFIKGFDNNIYKQFFTLMFFTGLRPGEAMALKFSDLDYCTLSINKTISEHSFNGSRVVIDPKSLCSYRIIDIDKSLYNNLISLKYYYIKQYNDFNFDYYIFGGKKPLAPTTINRYKNKACLLSGIRPIKLHEFRHSHASLLQSFNFPLQFIKERLGHSDIRITSEVYVHLTNKHKKRITRILNLLRFVI